MTGKRPATAIAIKIRESITPKIDRGKSANKARAEITAKKISIQKNRELPFKENVEI